LEALVRLYGVQAVDVEGVENGTYSFAKSPEEAHERVLVTGGPSSGKTRLLELIVAARQFLTAGERVIDQGSFIRPENKTCKVILWWQLTPDEQATIGAPGPVVSTEIIFRDEIEDAFDERMSFLLERYGHDDQTPKFEYFSERRRLDVGGGEASLEEDEQRGLRTDPGPRKFSWLPSFLLQLPDRPTRAARFADTLGRFSPSLAYDVERHVLTSLGRPLGSLRELSASEADALTFSATAALVGLSRSIVLVDRPELHGIDAAHAVAGLTALGTDNQLIVAAPSAALVASFDGLVVTVGGAAPGGAS
jgi:hypothetical protein